MMIVCQKCKQKTLYDFAIGGVCLQCISDRVKYLERKIKKLQNKKRK